MWLTGVCINYIHVSSSKVTKEWSPYKKAIDTASFGDFSPPPSAETVEPSSRIHYSSAWPPAIDTKNLQSVLRSHTRQINYK